MDLEIGIILLDGITTLPIIHSPFGKEETSLLDGTLLLQGILQSHKITSATTLLSIAVINVDWTNTLWTMTTKPRFGPRLTNLGRYQTAGGIRVPC